MTQQSTMTIRNYTPSTAAQEFQGDVLIAWLDPTYRGCEPRNLIHCRVSGLDGVVHSIGRLLSAPTQPAAQGEPVAREAILAVVRAPIFQTDEDTRALLASLEQELGVSGPAAVFRKAFAIAKEAAAEARMRQAAYAVNDLAYRLRSWGENDPDPDYFTADMLSGVLTDCGLGSEAILAAEARAAKAEAEVERLKARLEIDYAYDIDGKRVPFPEGLEHLDGIACRDETIKLGEERLQAAEARVAELKAALKACLNEMNWQIDAHGNCNTYGVECPLHDASKAYDSHFLARAAARAALKGAADAP